MNMLPLLMTTVADGIQFAYRDTGPPSKVNEVEEGYTTIVMIHGHTCHSGVFTKLYHLVLNRDQNEAHVGNRRIRIIAPNRRSYPGSTPYTPSELGILNFGSPSSRKRIFDREGTYLLLFIDRMIRESARTEGDSEGKGEGIGKVIIVGWSIGSVYLGMLVSALASKGEGKNGAGLSEECRKRLKRCMRGFMYLDAPPNALGIPLPPDTTLPIHDITLPPATRRSAYGDLLSRYFPHPFYTNVNSNNPSPTSRSHSTLLQHPSQSSPIKPPTFTHTPLQEREAMTDRTAGERGDNAFNELEIGGVLRECMWSGLGFGGVREVWGDEGERERRKKVWCVFGEESAWNVVWANWFLEDMVRDAELKKGEVGGGFEVGFRHVRGANHFMVYDNPELFLDVAQDCIDELG